MGKTWPSAFCSLVMPQRIDFAPGDAALLAYFAKLREDTLDQFVALRLHVAESGGHESADGSLGIHQLGAIQGQPGYQVSS
jgi:hypothetical protein